MNSKNKNSEWKIATKVIHLGGEPDPLTGAVMPPIYMTSTYAQSSPGQHKGYEYTRSHNPTRTRLETALCGLECGGSALSVASGMAATTLLMLALPKGSRIFCGDDVYGGTFRLFSTVFQDMHEFHFLDTTDKANLEMLAKDVGSPQMIWLETPTNPTLKISPIKKISELAKTWNCLVAVDNTFMTPVFQRPLDLGADLVIHSVTKYLNGHSDVLGGAIIFHEQQKDLYQKVWTLQNSTGPSSSPFDCWATLRGLKTLKIRMEAHQKNAQLLAEYLEAHSSVEKVIYPGLKSHPQHKLASEQCSGFGGMITFYLKGGIAESKKFLESVQLFTLAESLGGVESLIEHPAIMTHASVPPEKRKELGIADNLIRLSVGIEDIADIKADLEQAFRSL